MRVSKIIYQKKDPNRVNLFIDGEFFCGISLDTLAKKSLYEGLEISEDTLNQIMEMEITNRFLSRAMENIARGPKTEFQIFKYLRELKFKKKGIWFKDDLDINWEELFNTIVEKLKKYKYIDDTNYAQLFVSSRLRNRPRGKSILIGELMSKGVSKEIAQSVCDELVVDEYELLKNTFEKKYRGKRFDYKDTKMVNFLLRKGFSWDLIQQFKQDDTTE